MSMGAGERSRYALIEQRNPGRDALNQSLPGWVLVAGVWGNMRGETGMASVRNSGTEDGLAKSINAYSFRIGYRPTGVTTAMRLRLQTKDPITLAVTSEQTFNIKNIRHDHANREWTDLVLEEGGRDG